MSRDKFPGENRQKIKQTITISGNLRPISAVCAGRHAIFSTTGFARWITLWLDHRDTNEESSLVWEFHISKDDGIKVAVVVIETLSRFCRKEQAREANMLVWIKTELFSREETVARTASCHAYSDVSGHSDFRVAQLFPFIDLVAFLSHTSFYTSSSRKREIRKRVRNCSYGGLLRYHTRSLLEFARQRRAVALHACTDTLDKCRV